MTIVNRERCSCSAKRERGTCTSPVGIKAAEVEAPDVEIHPNVGEFYRRKVGELQTLLTDEASRIEAAEIVRALIERIEVHPGGKRSEAEVILAGALAGVLGYGCGQKKTAASGGGGRVLMVAGARKHRYRHSLAGSGLT